MNKTINLVALCIMISVASHAQPAALKLGEWYSGKFKTIDESSYNKHVSQFKEGTVEIAMSEGLADGKEVSVKGQTDMSSADRPQNATIELSKIDEMEINGRKWVKNGKSWAEVLQDGPIKMYRYYSNSSQGFGTTMSLQKGDDKAMDVSLMMMGFKKKMGDLVKDNDELAKKVNKKEKGYGWANTYAIVEEYNQWASEN